MLEARFRDILPVGKGGQMRLGFLLRGIPARWVRQLFELPPARWLRCRRRAPAIEGLEVRRPLAATAPMVIMDSATTADSWGVTVQYDLKSSPDDVDPLVFGVYRSADDRFDA